MKRARTTMLITAALATSLVMAAPLAARPHGEGRGCAVGFPEPAFGPPADPEMHIEHMVERLGLSNEQRDTVRAIIDQARPSMRKLHDDMMDERRQLRDLTSQGSPEDAKLRSLADALGNTIAEHVVLSTNVRLKIDKVLTEEQREQLRQFRGNRPVPGADQGSGR